MDALSRRVLEAFEESAREALEFSALAEFVAASPGQPPPGSDAAVRAAVAELAKQGCLRPAGASDAFARTEKGRLALAGPRDLTLYTRPGCHLCEEAKAQMSPLLREFGARLREINIDADPVLRERYNHDVPVVFLGSRKVAKHRLDLVQLRRQLASAAGDST